MNAVIFADEYDSSDYLKHNLGVVNRYFLNVFVVVGNDAILVGECLQEYPSNLQSFLYNPWGNETWFSSGLVAVRAIPESETLFIVNCSKIREEVVSEILRQGMHENLVIFDSNKGENWKGFAGAFFLIRKAITYLRCHQGIFQQELSLSTLLSNFSPKVVYQDKI